MKGLRTLPLAISFAGIALVSLSSRAAAQDRSPSPAVDRVAQSERSTTAAGAAPLRLTLQDALDRGRRNSVQFQSALTDAAIAREGTAQARDALLPTVTFNNQAIYTQPTVGGGVRFIASNAVHEYLSQGAVHEAIDLASISNYRRTKAAAALARARGEIASRGLVVAVVRNYYAAAAAQQKLEVARKAAEEGERFLKVTQDLESGGEVAHSDVIKAELQARERRRQLQEAQLGLLNARLDLAVLIFPDFSDNFEIAGDLHADVPLPTLGEIQQQAARENPDVRVALAAVQGADRDVTTARAGYLPSLSFDYFYGIDAPQFAVNGVVNGQRASNLGFSASATVNIPIWNWGATQSRIRQAELHRAQAQRELSLAQRTLLAHIRSLYAEAETAFNELGDLNRSATLAAESLELITLRYQAGESTVLEVVDAQSTYAQTNSAYQDGAVRYRVALANLQTLTGVLTIP